MMKWKNLDCLYIIMCQKFINKVESSYWELVELYLEDGFKWPFVGDTGEETLQIHCWSLQGDRTLSWYVSFNGKMVLQRMIISDAGGSHSLGRQLWAIHRQLWVDMIVLEARWSWNGHLSLTLGRLSLFVQVSQEDKTDLVSMIGCERFCLFTFIEVSQEISWYDKLTEKVDCKGHAEKSAQLFRSPRRQSSLSQ